MFFKASLHTQISTNQASVAATVFDEGELGEEATVLVKASFPRAWIDHGRGRARNGGLVLYVGDGVGAANLGL